MQSKKTQLALKVSSMLAKEKVTEDRWSTVEENERTPMLKTHSRHKRRLRVHNCEKGLTRRTAQSVRKVLRQRKAPWESTEQSRATGLSTSQNVRPIAFWG